MATRAIRIVVLALFPLLVLTCCRSHPRPELPETDSTSELLAVFARDITTESMFAGEHLIAERLAAHRDDPEAHVERIRLA